MYTDINGQTYKLEGNKAIIKHNSSSSKIEIFPTITFDYKEYEVVFPDNCYELFCGSCKLKEFTLHKLLHPTTNITSCKEMFGYCISLQELDLTNLNTDNVTNMKYMFVNCPILSYLNITSFNTKNVKIMNCMFYNTGIEKIDLSSFNTENVIDMSSMFACTEFKELDISNFNMDNVKYMHSMFCRSKIEKIYFPNFNSKNLKDICYIFYCCTQLKLVDLSSFNKETIRCSNNISKNTMLVSYKQTNEDKVIENETRLKELTEVRKFELNLYTYDINCNNSYGN